jgi:hypothetical protein
MDTRLVIFVALSVLFVAAIYSSSQFVVFALIKKGDVACVKKTENGITTESCCHTETDTQTGKKINYCTECKTTSDGTDMGCTHTQTDMTSKVLQGVKPSTTVESTEQASNNTGLMNGGSILKNGGMLKGGSYLKDSATTEINNKTNK